MYRGDETSAPREMLGFKVVVTKITEVELNFYLNFTNPTYVSIGRVKDLISA